MSDGVCTRFAITEVCRPGPISIVEANDFKTEPLGQIDSAQVLLDPRFSLYCFDTETSEAVFISVGDIDEVDKAPFYYQGQAAQAENLVRMPLREFHRLAQQIDPPPQGLIFVHSVGRCGSTLLSKVLQAIPSVHSLSEPDDLTQIGRLRIEGTLSDTSTRELLASSVRWRCKPRSASPAQFVAIKPRSEVMTLADLLGTSFPEARHLFLYRNAVSWMRTLFRGFPEDRDVFDEEKNREMEVGWAKSIPLVTEFRRDGEPMNAIEIRILAWVTCMESYVQLVARPIPVCAARFEDLTLDPLPVLERILTFCQIHDPDWDAIREVLGRDSQAGTIYDREERKEATRELTEDLVEIVLRLLASRPLLKTPDFRVPKTL